MAKVHPPPIQAPIIDDEGFITAEWALFFNSVYTGDTGTTWTPTLTGLTSTGTPTITGRYFKISQSLTYFDVVITPSTDTTSVVSTTYIDNFPLSITKDSAVHAVGGTVYVGGGIADAETRRIYLPAWSAVTVPVTICGTVEAR